MNTLEPPLSAGQWIDRAAAACALGDRARTRECLQNAAGLEPENGQLLLASGHIRLNLGDIAGALEDYSSATQLLPQSADAHASRALALQLLQRSVEARMAAHHALCLDETNVVALKVMARISLDGDQHEQARQFCREILTANPDDKDALAMLGQCRFDPAEVTGKAFLSLPRAAAPKPAPAGRAEHELRDQLRTLLNKEGFRRLQKLGFHLQRNDYYSPLNDCDFLEANRDLWEGQETPADIDWRLEDQLEVAREVAKFVDELRGLPVHPPEDGSAFGWKNNFWENADAIVQYGLVRSRRPARYVEIGCGWSSLLLKKALEQNAREGHRTEVTLIEPYPNARLFQHFPADWKIHGSILQRAPFEIFDRLEAGDVLFYDGSHCAKVASDVNWFFFKVLPRLKPGVIIHLHDISLPQDYPPPWIFERGQTWNEQYVLQAFLMHNRAYRILIANRFLFCNRQRELEQLYQNLQPAYGSSFWMEKLPAAVPAPPIAAADSTSKVAANGDGPQNSKPAPPAAERCAELGAIIQRAVDACERGDTAQARTHLTAARAHRPGHCDEALALGYVNLNVDDTSAALDCFTTAVQLDPKLAFAHSSRALALQLIGQSPEARREAEVALRLDPLDTVALKVLARISLNERCPADTQAYCSRILALIPQDPDATAMLRESATLAGAPLPEFVAASGPFTSANTPRTAGTATTRAPEPLAHHKKLDGLFGDYTARCEAWEALGPEHLTQQIVVGNFKQPIGISARDNSTRLGSDGLPVPPVELTMGYGAGDLDHYLACGKKSYGILKQLLQAHQVELNAGDAVLDWGGAAGRVVRNFIEETGRGVEVWGCDVHTPSIQWAQTHLSPPFKFFNSSSLPHLPFPDGAFKFIYAFSVMTHLIALRDLWLLELRRVLRLDGCLILTVHNESTWSWFREHGTPPWMPRELQSLPEMPGECVEIRGSRWEHCYTFFHSDYLRRIWGRYFEIKEIIPCADVYQAAVVLKPLASIPPVPNQPPAPNPNAS